jgi:nucleoside-diphosphate-sugar epimerase
MEDVLVTGASGFIGTNLCRHLVEEGYDVNGLDIKQPQFEHPSSVELHEIDLKGSSNIPEADVIVHLAAHSQVQPVVDDSSRAVENIALTQNVLEAAVEMDAFVVNASSRDVYGSSISPSEHEVTPDSPNGYAASKLGSEALVNAYRHTKGVSATSIRLANVYGPMDDNRRVIPLFIALADAGEELTVFGEGTLLDFVHVDDVCEAIGAAIRRSSIVEGESVNIGSGVGTPLTEVAEHIADAIETCPGWRSSQNRSGDVSKYVSDISTAEYILGYGPGIPFEDGIEETIEWYLDHPKILEKY